MPFTPSHIAAALPLLGTRLPASALVIGTMAPDLTYFLPIPTFRHLTHEWAGVPTIDLAIGLAVLALWVLVLRAPVIDALPAVLRDRIPSLPLADWRRGRPWPVALLLAVVALLLGILTHLVWDGFTHPDGWAVLALPGLCAEWGPLAAFRWLQHLSSVLGLVAVAVWTVLWVRRTPRLPDRRELLSSRARLLVWLGVVAVFGVAGLAAWLPSIAGGAPPLDPVVVFRVARVSIGCALAAAVIGVVAWHLAARRREPV